MTVAGGRRGGWIRLVVVFVAVRRPCSCCSPIVLLIFVFVAVVCFSVENAGSKHGTS